jgi:hypothetical protein
MAAGLACSLRDKGGEGGRYPSEFFHEFWLRQGKRILRADNAFGWFLKVKV